MDDDAPTPVLVRLTVKCDRCGYGLDELYQFRTSVEEAEPKEGCEPGKCPQCGAKLLIHLKREKQLQ